MINIELTQKQTEYLLEVLNMDAENEYISAHYKGFVKSIQEQVDEQCEVEEENDEVLQDEDERNNF